MRPNGERRSTRTWERRTRRAAARSRMTCWTPAGGITVMDPVQERGQSWGPVLARCCMWGVGRRFAGEVESFETLGRLMRDYNVGHAVIDALPETRKARELQEDFPPHVVWLAYYVGQKTGTKRTLPEQE